MVTPRRVHRRADYVKAAVRYVDEHGADSLTLRSLGDSLGVAHTALYRHFRDKAELVAAMTNYVLLQAALLPVETQAGPAERIYQMAMNVRAVFMRHPNIAVIMGSVASPEQMDIGMTAVVVAELERLGVPPDQIPACYQMLESYVIGTQAYDLSAAPNHLESRRQRHRRLDHPAFTPATASSDAIAANNDAAFDLGLRAVIGACVTIGRNAQGAGAQTAQHDPA